MATINLSPNRPTLNAAALEQLVLLYLQAKRPVVQPVTLACYAARLAYVRRWWKETGPAQAWNLSEQDMASLEYWLRQQRCSRTERPLSYHTRFDILRVLRQMFHWAHRYGYITERDCAFWVPSPDGTAPKRKAATLIHLRRLFRMADYSGTPTRDRAILALFIGTGMRRAECATIRIEDIHFSDSGGTIAVTGKRTRANRSGERELAFDAVTGRYLREYLLELNQTRGPLFPGRKEGESLTGMTIYRIVKRMIREAQLEDVIQGCHDLRRAFATHYSRMFRGEGHADILRRQMGHTSYRMTAQYDLTDAEEIRKVLVSPLTVISEKPLRTP